MHPTSDFLRVGWAQTRGAAGVRCERGAACAGGTVQQDVPRDNAEHAAHPRCGATDRGYGSRPAHGLARTCVRQSPFTVPCCAGDVLHSEQRPVQMKSAALSTSRSVPIRWLAWQPQILERSRNKKDIAAAALHFSSPQNRLLKKKTRWT